MNPSWSVVLLISVRPRPSSALDHPTAAWTVQQLVESFPEETAPTYLLRDRDAIYGAVFAQRIKRMGIHEVLIAPRAP